MAYLLEKRIVQRRDKSSQIIWRRYAACGSPGLLEQVRMGQKYPENWRVVLENAAPLAPMKEAG